MPEPPAAALLDPRRAHAERLRRAQLRRALRRLGHLDEHDRAVVEALSEDLVTALLQVPLVAHGEERADE